MFCVRYLLLSFSFETKNRGHGASSDHWALGVLVYEMVAGENPFFYDGMSQIELFQCIVREKFYPLPDEVSDDCFCLVDELLEKDPNQRLGSLAGRGKGIIPPIRCLRTRSFRVLFFSDISMSLYCSLRYNGQKMV